MDRFRIPIESSPRLGNVRPQIGGGGQESGAWLSPPFVLSTFLEDNLV